MQSSWYFIIDCFHFTVGMAEEAAEKNNIAKQILYHYQCEYSAKERVI